MWKWFKLLFLDQRGIEGDAGAGDASVVSGDEGDGGLGGGDAGAGDSGAGEAGQAGEAPVTPKFGEFGDDPNEAAGKLFEAFNRQKGDFENFKTKQGLTERNLASVRKALEGSGIRYNEETGQVEPIKQQERKVRFTDQHKSLFDQKVLEAMQMLIDDRFDEQYEGREKMSSEKRQQMQRFMSEKSEVEGLMMDTFPQLDQKDPNFNKAFYDRATHIWQEQFGGNPLKQLSAALKAAKELNIWGQPVAKAKAEGVKLGKQDKRILGLVGGIGAPAGGGTQRVLSKDEVLALPEDKRETYDKWRLEHPDAK